MVHVLHAGGSVEMLTYLLPDGVQRLVLQPDVLRHLLDHRQTKFWQKEAGGQLFATINQGLTTIERVTGPRKTDRRSRTGYRPDRKAEQREIDEMYAVGLHYVGDWHTHPERIRLPSEMDKNSMVECFSKSNHQAEGFLLIIVGNGEPPACLSVSSTANNGLTPLVRVTTAEANVRPAWGPGGVLSSPRLSESNPGKGNDQLEHAHMIECNTKPKLHHYVPQMLLCGFVDAHNKLHLWRKPSRSYWSQKTDQPFAESHLYSFIGLDGKRDPELELRFSKLEGRATGVLKKVRAAGVSRTTLNLSAEERLTLDEFLQLQMIRTPSSIAKLAVKQPWEMRIKEAVNGLGRPLDPSEQTMVSNPNILRQNVTVTALSSFDPFTKLMSCLSMMAIQIGIVETPGTLGIGSHPVVRFSSQQSSDIRDPGVQLWLPISSDVAFSLVHTDIPEQTVNLSDEFVAMINRRAFGQSDIFAMNSKKQLTELVRKADSTTTPTSAS